MGYLASFHYGYKAKRNKEEEESPKRKQQAVFLISLIYKHQNTYDSIVYSKYYHLLKHSYRLYINAILAVSL